MDGTSGYNLVRFDQPGIIAPVRLTREQADAFCDAVRTARAEAWDEGFAAGVNADMGDYAHPPENVTNPYRAAEDEDD